MSNLMPHLGSSLDALHSGQQQHVPRDIVRAVSREHGYALVAAARVDGRAFVTRTALLNTALLSADEANLLRLAPHAHQRLSAIVDSYTIWATGQVGRP